MAIENKLVKFGYGFNAAESVKEGVLSFDASAQAIYVGDGSTANLVTSSVKDATFENGILTIYKVNSETPLVLNFGDLASATATMAAIKSLDDKIGGNTTAIESLSDKLDASLGDLDTAYKAADTALSNRIAELETAVGEGGSVETQINNAIDALAGSAEDVDDSSLVKVAVTSENGEVKTVTVTTDDIAKASDLSAHTGNGDIHVTKAEKDRWTAAAEDVEEFFKDALSDGAEQVKDTLKEIQDYIASDATAAAEMTASIKAAKDAADAAQGDVDAVEEALGTGFSKESTVTAQLAAVKATADAAAVKTSVDTSLGLKADKSALEATDASITAIKNSYVISFGGAKGAISVDTENATQGHVKFTMDGSTLKGAVNGLGSAAYVDTTEFDASGSASAAQTAAINAVTGTAEDTSAAKTIEGTRKYAAELVAAVPAATVTGVNSANKADDKGYVTIALELNNKEVAVKSVAVDTQAVADATEANDGLATAYDVKQYVDSKDAAMDGRMDAVEAQLKWVIL